jgi:pimeloyl-ACP methyl ester carboxylesterase
MKIYFSHGKETGPYGRKIKVLSRVAESLGLETISIDYRESLDPDFRAQKLIEILKDENQEVLLVGSSMGGYVSLVAAGQAPVKGLFLLAPAIYLEGYAQQEFDQPFKNTEIFHGWADDVVPASHSVRYATGMKCSLNLLQADHGLSEVHILEVIENRFRVYLENILKSK